MNNHKTRIEKLETARNVGKANKYLCVIGIGTPEEKAKGYEVQPLTREAGGDCLYFKTRAELDEFAARDDVDLDILTIRREEKVPSA